MKEFFAASETNKEKWNRRYTNNFFKPKPRSSNKYVNLIEGTKAYLLSSEVGLKLLSLQRKLTQLTEVADVDLSTKAKQAYALRIISAICWSLLAYILLGVPLQILSNIDSQLDNWFINIIIGVKFLFGARNLLIILLFFAAYGFLCSQFYVHPVPICRTRFDYVIQMGIRKMVLLCAQIIFVLGHFYTYLPEEISDQILTYMYITTINVVLYNFWTQYLFQPFKLKFDLILTPAYEELCQIIRPRLWTNMKHLFRPLWKSTVLLYYIINAAHLIGETGQRTLITPKISVLYQLWIILVQSLSAIQTLDSLIKFKLTRPLNFAIKHKTGKPFLLDALQVQYTNPWIFENAARDFLLLSQSKTHYTELYITTYEQAPFLFKDIANVSLEIVQNFTIGMQKKFESPCKLLNKELIERAATSYGSQHILKSLHDRDGFIVSLSKAPTLCRCPIGPTRPAKPVLSGYINRFFWYHAELYYKLLSCCKLIHLWHFFFCPTFGVDIRYLLQDTEPIEAIIRAVLNICIAAHKDNTLHVIKYTIPIFLKALMDLIEIAEYVPLSSYQLYGLDDMSFGKLRSLQTHAKHSLFRLLECYGDKLLIFIQPDLVPNINLIIKLYKWPLNLQIL